MFHLMFPILAYVITIPARIKGMKIGTGSYFGGGYDFLFVQLKNITIGAHVAIGRNAWIQTVDDGEIRVGNQTTIGRRCTISARKLITIGEHCIVSYNVSILDHDHLVQDKNVKPTDGKLTKGETITIGDECFIGANVCILKGVTLGKHCVVGANSVVTKSYPAYSVIAGNPAKLIRMLT